MILPGADVRQSCGIRAGEASAPNVALAVQGNSRHMDSSRGPALARSIGSYSPRSDDTTDLLVNDNRKYNLKAVVGQITTSKAKRALSTLNVEDLDTYLNGQWTVQTWLENVWDRCNVKQLDILCRLGLVAPGAATRHIHGVFLFDDSNLTELSKVVHELAQTFHEERFDQIHAESHRRPESGIIARNWDDGRNAFIEAACNPVHMNQELSDLLFDRFGPNLWGMDVAPREGCTYRLELEDDSDRPKIEALLYLWVFVKIANKCRTKRQTLSSTARRRQNHIRKEAGMAGMASGLLMASESGINREVLGRNMLNFDKQQAVGHNHGRNDGSAGDVGHGQGGDTDTKYQKETKANRSVNRHNSTWRTVAQKKLTVDSSSNKQDKQNFTANAEETFCPAPPKADLRSAHDYTSTDDIFGPNDDLVAANALFQEKSRPFRTLQYAKTVRSREHEDGDDSRVSDERP